MIFLVQPSHGDIISQTDKIHNHINYNTKLFIMTTQIFISSVQFQTKKFTLFTSSQILSNKTIISFLRKTSL